MMINTGQPRPSHIGDAEVEYREPSEILTRATGFMGAYDFTLNPYSGCSFGCTYCYAAFFSREKEKIDTWGKWVVAKYEEDKENKAIERIKSGRRSLDGKLIYMSSVTDPYQPVERQLRLTRRILEVIAERHKPKLVVQTRSPDVTRDIDLFKKIEECSERPAADMFSEPEKVCGRVQVNMTVTTDDEDIRRTFEPYCPSNMARLKAIAEVQAAGIQACITMTPLLLVSDPHAFVESLLNTGVKKFIAQPFHFTRGKFVANTREKAFDLMAEKLGCKRSEFQKEYLTHYEKVFKVLKDGLPELGEGKDGFKPPF